MIPKILHFTWKTTALTGAMRRYFERWRALHLGWDIRLWTDETMRAFVGDTYPELLATYDGYGRMIERADAFRYMVLDALGGVYSDLDVEPLRPIDELAERFDGFVGVEPAEHIAGDRIHAGVPFLLSNAFMGSVPKYALWRDLLARLPGLADQETFFATGPSMLTATVLRTAPADRPTLLLPGVWSPLRDGGLPTRGDAVLVGRLKGVAPLMEGADGPLVSHKWLTTWVKWHERHSPFQVVVQTPTHIKWWLRRLTHPALAAVRIPDPSRAYTDQRIAPATPGPSVFVGVRLDGDDRLDPSLAASLAALSYPPRLRQVGVVSAAEGEVAREAARRSVAEGLPEAAFLVFAGDAVDAPAAVPRDALGRRAGRNNLLIERGAALADKVVLVGGEARQFPANTVEVLLGAGRPLVAANPRRADGSPEPSVFRYGKAPNFRTLWKSGGRSGAVRAEPEFRMLPDAERAFAVVVADGVGDHLLLIDSGAIRAGAHFAADRYKLHRNGEALGIMARDLGFEAAALPGLVVTTV